MPAIEVPIAGLIGPDTEDALQQQFLENNWTDKLPIVLPTRERVDAMVKATSHAPAITAFTATCSTVYSQAARNSTGCR